MPTVREKAEDALVASIRMVVKRACDAATPTREVPVSLSNFQVTLKKSVYKDPSLHYFDVRRLYRIVKEEGLLEILIKDATPMQLEADAKESAVVEAQQLQLLEVVSREAEDLLKRTGASFLGSVLLQEKKATVKHFQMLKVVGKGSFGKVMLAKHKSTNHMYAIKVMDKEIIIEQDAVDRIISEHNVLLSNECHPFLVGLHYSFQSPMKLYFVLDYVNGGELYFHLNQERTFSVERSRFYAAEVTSALGYLHGLNILYRDLKPENILLDSLGHVVLTDFGLCKEHVPPGGTTGTFCGTPEYLAPEMLQKQPYGRGVDWWCLGCVLYEMLFGLPPFYSSDWNEMYEKILSWPLKYPTSVPVECRSFLEGLLARDPRMRLGAGRDDVKAVRSHPFFSSIDWEALERKEIIPPFDPQVTGSLDLRNFDPEVTQEPIPKNIDTESLGLPSPLAFEDGGATATDTEDEDQASFQGLHFVGELDS
eukprot:m.338662 g.338662  ORF g.338662 m.338662 type:complete len:480 (+) comp18496_c0_seq1:215-1654(+)